MHFFVLHLTFILSSPPQKQSVFLVLFRPSDNLPPFFSPKNSPISSSVLQSVLQSISPQEQSVLQSISSKSRSPRPIIVGSLQSSISKLPPPLPPLCSPFCSQSPNLGPFIHYSSAIQCFQASSTPGPPSRSLPPLPSAPPAGTCPLWLQYSYLSSLYSLFLRPNSFPFLPLSRLRK